MLNTHVSETRLIANELVGIQNILDASNVRTIKAIEPLMYRRLRDLAKREQRLDSFDYATALHGTILEDTFDPNNGPKRQADLVRAIMRIIEGTTLRSRELTWASRLLEERINRRLKGQNVHVHVQIGKFRWSKFNKSKKRLTFRFWAEDLRDGK